MTKREKAKRGRFDDLRNEGDVDERLRCARCLRPVLDRRARQMGMLDGVRLDGKLLPETRHLLSRLSLDLTLHCVVLRLQRLPAFPFPRDVRLLADNPLPPLLHVLLGSSVPVVGEDDTDNARNPLLPMPAVKCRNFDAVWATGRRTTTDVVLVELTVMPVDEEA